MGLDPRISDLAQPTADGMRDFCLQIIEATQDFAAAFKPNSAFFEVFGAAGIQALQEVIAAIPKDIPVILDAKRGDIGSTAHAYAQAAFGTLKAGALTVNPYLGRDAVEPFLTDPAKGVFLLCKTSNPGAGDLQDLIIGTQPLYLQVAQLAAQWNKKRNVGLVVGATYPHELAAVRQTAPDLWFLSPGIGSQGADAQAAITAGLRPDGLGMLASVSRGISQADQPDTAARRFRNSLIKPVKPERLPEKLFVMRLSQLTCCGWAVCNLENSSSNQESFHPSTWTCAAWLETPPPWPVLLRPMQRN